MYFADFIMSHKEVVFEFAKENEKADNCVFDLYDAWQKSECEDEMINFYL